jgi:hypothetical protein
VLSLPKIQHFRASFADKVGTKEVSKLESPRMAWNCTDDLEVFCELVPACDDEVCRISLNVRIHGKWYDLLGWRKAHPAGEHWIDYYDGRDATEVMDAFHSVKGRKM